MRIMAASYRWLVLAAVVALSVSLLPAASPAATTYMIAFGSSRTGSYQIYTMTETGSTQTLLTGKSPTDRQSFDPAWSPRGKELVFESDRDTGKYSDLWKMSASGSKPQKLTNLRGPSRVPAWSPNGRWIAFAFGGPYVTTGRYTYKIYVMVSRPKLPVTSVKPLSSVALGSCSNPAWSPRSDRIAFDCNGDIYSMSFPGGKPINLTRSPEQDLNPSWSPDGEQITFGSNRSGTSQIWVMSAKGGTPTQLTGKSSRDGQNFDPSWSPDGRTIAFASNRDGNIQIYSMSADGSKQTRLTRNSAVDLAPNFWQNPR